MSTSIFDKIIKPEYRDKLQDWQNYANSEQLLGLSCIEQIYQSKGNKRISLQLPTQKQFYDTFQSLMTRHHSSNIQQAQSNFRLKQLTTSYQFFHGGYSAPSKKQNIFQFKTLSKLDLARPLNSMAVTFIDNWLSLKEDKKYEQPVLSCLRSLNSKLFVSDPKTTEMRTSFRGKLDWSLSKPLRVDKIGEDLYAFKPNLTAIKRQEEKQKKLREKLKQLEKTDFAKQLTIFKQFKIN